jgi:LPS O-antigen subunit length determinant protein (WzzB/FepE family)
MAKEKGQSDLSVRMETLRELFRFLWKRKLWWLIPMVVLLVLFALLLVFAQASGLAPFIYPLF